MTESDSIESISLFRHFLNENGSLKSVDNMSSIIQNMESLKTVAGRSLVVNILKSTAIFSARKVETKEVLMRFLRCGGWKLLGVWFKDAVDSKYFTFLTQIVETLALFPITIDLLRASAIPKSLKIVVRFECKALQTASKKLLLSWKKYVKDVNIKSKIVSKANKQKQTTFVDSLAEAIGPPQKSRKRTLIIRDEDETPPPVPSVESIPDTFENTSTANDYDSCHLTNNGVTDDIDADKCKKRRVTFKEEGLVEVFFFEMTEQERSEMHGERPHLNFDEARHLELIEEKKALCTAKLQQAEPNTREWMRAVEIEDIIDNPRGTKSDEKKNQADRESNILPPIFLEASQIPQSPFEPVDEDMSNVLLDDCLIKPTEYNLEAPVICIPYWEKYFYSPKTSPPPRKSLGWVHRGGGRRDFSKPRFTPQSDILQSSRQSTYHRGYRRRGFRGRSDPDQESLRRPYGNKERFDKNFISQRSNIYDGNQHIMCEYSQSKQCRPMYRNKYDQDLSSNFMDEPSKLPR